MRIAERMPICHHDDGVADFGKPMLRPFFPRRFTEKGRGNLGSSDTGLGEATQHQVNHCQMNHRLAGFVPVIVVFAQATII